MTSSSLREAKLLYRVSCIGSQKWYYVMTLSSLREAKPLYLVSCIGFTSGEVSPSNIVMFLVPFGPLPDIIYIATITTNHYAPAMLMMEAGKNVLIEKVMSVNSRLVKELLDKAKEKGVFLVEVCSSRRWLDTLSDVLKWSFVIL